jgi:hypothetical protein
MRCGQAAKMPDAVSVVRAATTPSAIAPFETTESGRELGQAEPLMAPWWKLEAGGPYCYCALCKRPQCSAGSVPREDCCATAQRRRLAMHLRGGRRALRWRRACLTPHSATLCRVRQARHLPWTTVQCWCSSETVLISAANAHKPTWLLSSSSA